MKLTCTMFRGTILTLLASVINFSSLGQAYNNDGTELDCPQPCDCYYFRVNWVTDCSESNLVDIPYEALSDKVYVLDLNGNSIASMRPFPPDIKIRRLQMADNLLTELRAETFVGLNSLIDCDFASNRIRTIEPHLFEDCNGLISLELQDNVLATMPGVFLSSGTLLYLDISNCTLQELTPQFFSEVTSLSTLDLSNNPLGELHVGVLTPLKSLQTLKMNHCNLSHIDNDAFQFQSTLKVLELAGNNFKTVNWPMVLESLVRLEHLDLRAAGLTAIPEDMFNNSLYLRTLILAENTLHNFDIAASIGQQLIHLDLLDLSYCNLSEPLSEDAFAESNKIRTLNLSGNSLFAMDLLVALSPLTTLEKLALSNCELTVLPDTFHNFKSLKELDISHNPLNDVFVKLITPLDTLEYLNMGYSNLSHLAPNTFSKMTSMRRLVLSGNDLNSLEAGLFADLTNLESLELNFCGLKRPLNATVFFTNFTYTDLTELQLAGNPLRVTATGILLPRQLSRLEILDLSNCNLTVLPTDAFKWTQKIRELYLQGNHLQSFSSLRSVGVLAGLELLDLRYNKLDVLTSSDVAFAVDLKTIRLVGNPWKCDCALVELWRWANATKESLGLLEGATIGVEHVTVGKVKRKNLLVCILPTDIRYSKAGVKTWAKYVKESRCEKPHVRKRSLAVEIVSAEKRLVAERVYEENAWVGAATVAIICYFVLLAILGIAFLCNNNRKHTHLAD